MPNWDNIAESEEVLSRHFESLRENREGPVFFIEHGLTEVESTQLRKTVSGAARHHPLHANWWKEHPLPLLVAATEVGYAYRGSGTDFWPKLEAALRTSISLEARRRIRDLFDSCSTRYRGARPPVTRWTTAFRLIAWPVTHALVPLEFHRQLSAALARLRSDVRSLDDDRLHRSVRIAARNPSARFETFLEDRSHSVPVIRALVGGGSGEISRDTVTRIELDVTADRDARLDIEIAKRMQRRLRKPPAMPVAPSPREVLDGHLQLRCREGNLLSLEARFPAVQGPNAERLRRTLRRRLYRPKLWGAASPVPSEWLFSGVPFQVTLTDVPDVTAPLLQGLEQLEIDAELVAILEKFRLDLQPPLVFAANDDRDLGRFVRGNEISVLRQYWLLAEKEEANRYSGLPQLGEVGPFVCFKLDPTQGRAADELRQLGYTVRQGLAGLVAGAPPLDDRSTVPQFLVGDERIVAPRREASLGTQTQVGLGSESIAMDGRLVRVRVTEGEHVLEIVSDDARRREPFQGVPTTDRESQRVCWIELSADERTVQGLLGGSIALRVDGLAPLDGLTLTVELETGGWCTGTSVPLDPLPQTLGAGQEPWLTLLDTATRERLLQDRHPIVLHARAGSLAQNSWTLETTLRPLWWKRAPAGPFLDSEHGPVPHGEISIARPTEKPVATIPDGDGEAVLLAPLEPDEAIFGPSARFVTFCTAPATTSLMAPRMKKPRLRRARSGSSGAVGMQELLEAWLRWSVAESDTLTADLRKQQAARQLDLWIAEIACGEVWVGREVEIRVPSADPWKLLVEECLTGGRGLDELAKTNERDDREVVRLAVARIRRDHPDLWVRIGQGTAPDADSRELLLGDDDYAELDSAFAAAYEDLAREYRGVGKNQVADLLESADPGSAPDEWDPVLEAALAASELRQLTQLLTPTDTARRLLSLDLTLMPIGEIAEELQAWATESRRAFAGGLPSEQTLKVILALWIAPATAVQMDWRIALDPLVAERSLARAARYLALRARSIRHEEGLR